ncbi:MAG: hypothetical protein AB7I30_23875, partial [Isosphaeraceae bacterium]
LLLMLFSRPGPIGPGWPASMFLIGFLQGWLSFDHCFLVTFAAPPIALMVSPAGSRPSVRSLLALVVATGLGFTLAHVLHFLQTVVYAGGLTGAFEEYASRASKKYGLEGTELDGLSRPALLAYGLSQMVVVYFRWTHLFSPASLVVFGLTIVACLMSRTSGTFSRRFRVDAHFAPSNAQVLGVALALGLGLLWLFAKPYHAINHMGFVGRHLFLFYLCCGLLLARATTLRIGWKERGRSHWWPSRDVFKHARNTGARVSSRALAASFPRDVGLNGRHTEETAETGPVFPH